MVSNTTGDATRIAFTVKSLTGVLALSATGEITLTSGAASDIIITTGTTGTVTLDSVVVDAGAVSAVTTLAMSDTLTSSDTAIALTSVLDHTITHTSATGKTLGIVSTNGKISMTAAEAITIDGGGVTVESVVMNDGAVSAITTLGMSGDLTSSAGSILLTNKATKGIHHTCATGVAFIVKSLSGILALSAA